MKKQNPRKGDQIRFWAMNEFTGANTLMIGKVIGHGKEVRKLYPVEMANGIDSHYVVVPNDVDSIINLKEEKNV